MDLHGAYDLRTLHELALAIGYGEDVAIPRHDVPSVSMSAPSNAAAMASAERIRTMGADWGGR